MARATETETSFWDPRSETMPRRDLEQLQTTRVRSCLKQLKASGIEYYRERLSDIETDKFRSLEDLRSLPFTAKDDLREHYPFGLFLIPRSEILRVHASTGSTGKPTVVGYTRFDLTLWADVLARGLVAGGLTNEDVFQNAYEIGRAHV
jgi:phenylacetate-CoA ligase